MEKQDLKTRIIESLALPVDAAVAKILSESFSKGTRVAILEDPVYGYDGRAGVVDGPADKGEGWLNVRLDNGTIVPLQSTLLTAI